jgi:hypothetical protein
MCLVENQPKPTRKLREYPSRKVMVSKGVGDLVRVAPRTYKTA